MDLEQRISQTLEPLSSFKKERWSDAEYEVEATNVNDLTVFLSFTEDGTVLNYHYVSPISYGSLTEENRQLVDNCLSSLNALSPRGNWYLEELEKESPDEEDLEFLMYKATWSNTCPPEQVGSELFNTLLVLGDLYGFVRMFMLGAEDISTTNNKEEEKMQLKQYRDPWLAEKFDEFIGFYPREFYCFDNFSSFGIDYKGYQYPTVEHAYQALKFENSCPELAVRIRESMSAHEAQKLAYAHKDKVVADWDNIKVAVMEDLLRAKLAQNPYVARKLLQTKDYEICEDSPKDSWWGLGPDRAGKNQLGKLWLKLRDELRLQVKSECEAFTQCIIEKSARFRNWSAATLITYALSAVGYVRQNVSEAKKHGFWGCGTHMSNVRKHLAMVLLHEYREEKLATLVDCCKAGCPAENEEFTELLTDLIISYTPHIHLNLGKSVADHYQTE